MNTPAVPIAGPGYTLWQMVLYMLRLGTLGFGGPVALVGYMHRDLVERRGWISEADYKEGLALAQYNLGLSYERGEGVAKDPVAAYKWLALAVRGGVTAATKDQLDLASTMTSAQFSEALRLSREFKPTTSNPADGATGTHR